MVLKRSLTLLVASTLAALAAASIVALLGLSAQQAQAQEWTDSVSDTSGQAQDQGASTSGIKVTEDKKTTLRFTVTLSPDARAQRIFEQLTFPKSFNLKSAKPNQGACGISGRQVNCNYDVVQPGQTVYVDVTFTPKKAGKFDIPALICGTKAGCVSTTYRISVVKS